MDKLVKLHGSCQGAFTKFTDMVQNFLASKVDNLDSSAEFLAQLQEKCSKVETVDKEILDMLQKDEECSQEMLDEEIEGTKSVNGTFIDLKIKLD